MKLKEFDKMNVHNPKSFAKELENTYWSIYDLIKLARDKPDGKDDKNSTPIQIASQFERPDEFIQCILDSIAVTFNPSSPPASYLLNGNPDYLYENIPKEPFQLGYISLTSDDHAEFGPFWDGKVTSYIKNMGYDLNKADKVFVMVSTGERISQALFEEIRRVLNGADFGGKEPFMGIGYEEGLRWRIRVSLWLI